MEKKINNAGTWFLSYLCEIGIIENNDTVQHNYVTGKLMKDFCDVPAGYCVYITMNDSETLNIIYAPSETVDNFYEEDEQEDLECQDGQEDNIDTQELPWFCQNFVFKKTKQLNLSFK